MNRAFQSTSLALTMGLLIVLSGCRNGPSSWTTRDRSSADSIARGEIERSRRRLDDERRYAEDRTRDDRRRDTDDIEIRPKRRDDLPRRDSSVSIARHTADRSSRDDNNRTNPFALIKNRREAKGRDPFLNARGLADTEDDISTRRDSRDIAQTRQFPVDDRRSVARATRRDDDVVPSLDEYPNRFSPGFERSMSRVQQSNHQRLATGQSNTEQPKTSAPGFPQVSDRKPEVRSSAVAPGKSPARPEGVNPFARFAKKPEDRKPADVAVGGMPAAKIAKPITAAPSDDRSYKPLPAKTASNRSFSNSTAQLPDPTRSPDVSAVSEGDPSLIVDSNSAPAKGARSASNAPLDFKSTPASRDTRSPVITPRVPNKSDDAGSSPQDIQIIPRNKRSSDKLFHSASTTEETSEWKGADEKATAKEPKPAPTVVQANATKPKPLARLDDPSPFDDEPMPSLPAKAETPRPAFAPEAPQAFPSHGKAKPMPTESLASPFALPQPSDARPMPRTEAKAPAPPSAVSPVEEFAASEGEVDAPNRTWLWVCTLLVVIAIGALVHKRRQFYFA